MRPLRTKTKVLADEYITESPLDTNNGPGKKVNIYFFRLYYRTLNRHRFVGRVY